eukprot:1665471-Pleurochrysis_carterae.AAC.1
MKIEKIDVVALQELNVHRQDRHTIDAHKNAAQTLGYKMFLAPTATPNQVGGTAILIAQTLSDDGATASLSHTHPKGNSIHVKLTIPVIGLLDVWSVYAPADSNLRRDFFLRMAAS